MADELATWSAVRLAAALRTKKLSSRELLDLYLDRIDRLNGPINAVVTLDAERARTAAGAADDALARGDDVGPLHGLPITIKDAIETEGIRSTGGAIELTDHVPAADAPAVTRLKDAGAIVFGKTNVPRWSGDLQTYNEVFGVTSNPWALDRTPGGSSGGPAAAVAAGFTSFELGTDIAGSIRLPSHMCGVFGLKPSYGVIPQRGYLDHVGGGITDADINVFGPIARDADDLALLLDVLAGPEPERATAWRLELPPAGGSTLSDYRIGVWFDDPGCPVGRDVSAVLANAAARIADAGGKIEDAHPPVNFEEQVETFFRLLIPAIAPSFPEETAEIISASHLAWLRNNEERARLRAVWAEWFAGYDILLCPVLPMATFPHDNESGFASRRLVIDGVEREHVSLVRWTGLIGVVELPSAVIPVGRTEAGFPVGMQIVSPYLHDRRSVHVAQLLRDVLGGYEPPPGY